MNLLLLPWVPSKWRSVQLLKFPKFAVQSRHTTGVDSWAVGCNPTEEGSWRITADMCLYLLADEFDALWRGGMACWAVVRRSEEKEPWSFWSSDWVWEELWWGLVEYVTLDFRGSRLGAAFWPGRSNFPPSNPHYDVVYELTYVTLEENSSMTTIHIDLALQLISLYSLIWDFFGILRQLQI